MFLYYYFKIAHTAEKKNRHHSPLITHLVTADQKTHAPWIKTVKKKCYLQSYDNISKGN